MENKLKSLKDEWGAWGFESNYHYVVLKIMFKDVLVFQFLKMNNDVSF